MQAHMFTSVRLYVCVCVGGVNQSVGLTPVLLKQYSSRVLQVSFGTAHYGHQFRMRFCILTKHLKSDGHHTVFTSV